MRSTWRVAGGGVGFLAVMARPGRCVGGNDRRFGGSGHLWYHGILVHKEWPYERTHERTRKRTYERTHERTYERSHECSRERAHECSHERSYERAAAPPDSEFSLGG